MANAWSLAAPARTPPEVIAKINKAMRDAVADARVQARFVENGMIPRGGTPVEATAEMEESYQKWGALIRARNIKAE
jgi:tripartite-type tricarboxylate transporter receptor subunit TctC